MEPSICFGNPMTIFSISYFCIICASSSSADDISCSVQEMVLNPLAVSLSASLIATPIVFEPTSKPRILIYFPFVVLLNKISLIPQSLRHVLFSVLDFSHLYTLEYKQDHQTVNTQQFD